jgi:hypothetical protein
MDDWKQKLYAVKRKIYIAKRVDIKLPNSFVFKRHGLYDFSPVLKFFDWSLKDCPVRIDFSECHSANYQALTLLVSYVMKLRANGCTVSFEFGKNNKDAPIMWRYMGALGAFIVMTDETANFKGHQYKPLFAIRNRDDFKAALSKAEEYCSGFNVEYINTLRYVISELLYNTLEHGASYFELKNVTKRIPSVLQFTWYETRHEIHFIIVDVGVGIKTHLEQAYPKFDSDEAAISKAIQPGVSGTFGRADPYTAKDNQGVGLYISSNIVRRLRADMHIVSGNGVLHVSGRDVTSRTIAASWPGTFVLVSLKVEPTIQFALSDVMQELRQNALNEIRRKSDAEAAGECYINISNYFGRSAEDKDMAIRIRDTKIMPALSENKNIVFDFDDVVNAPHSFLGALLATPVKNLGMAAYKKLRFVNCRQEIRETIDFILNDNT